MSSLTQIRFRFLFWISILCLSFSFFESDFIWMQFWFMAQISVLIQIHKLHSLTDFIYNPFHYLLSNSMQYFQILVHNYRRIPVSPNTKRALSFSSLSVFLRSAASPSCAHVTSAAALAGFSNRSSPLISYALLVFLYFFGEGSRNSSNGKDS